MSNLTEEYLQAYGEHAKVLRTWLVAYGIGAPVLLMTNETLAAAVKTSGESRCIALSFISGVVLQVVLSTINKGSMWGLYYGETQDKFKKTWRYEVSHWISERYWIDFWVDLATMGLFAYATWQAFEAVFVGS
jgi:hypothetical protein